MNRFQYVAAQAVWKHRSDLSDKTLANRRQEVKSMGAQLWLGGFKLTELRQLKGKSIGFLLDVWQGKKMDPVTGRVRALAPATLENKISTLRRVCEWAGKSGLVPKTSRKLGLVPRERYERSNVAWSLKTEGKNVERISANLPHIRYAVRLQEQLGLRKKEALRLNVAESDKGSRLYVVAGTKGGRPRWVPIRTQEQRQLLNEVREFQKRTPRGTLITGATQKATFDDYKRGMQAAEFTKGHGLRHQYAQDRYQALTGRPCEKAGGLPSFRLSVADEAEDRRARELLARELGHGRIEVVAVYIGR